MSGFCPHLRGFRDLPYRDWCIFVQHILQQNLPRLTDMCPCWREWCTIYIAVLLPPLPPYVLHGLRTCHCLACCGLTMKIIVPRTQKGHMSITPLAPWHASLHLPQATKAVPGRTKGSLVIVKVAKLLSKNARITRNCPALIVVSIFRLTIWREGFLETKKVSKWMIPTDMFKAGFTSIVGWPNPPLLQIY